VPQQISLRSLAAEDGSLMESSETSNVGGLAIPVNDEIQIGDQADGRQFKGIVAFDTSVLPDNAVVTAATLRLRRTGLFGVNPFTTHGTCRIEVGPIFGGDTALLASDFQAAATVSDAGVLGNAAATGQWSEGTIGAAGLAAINRTGQTQFRLAFDLDDNDNRGADRMRYGAGDVADPTLRPELVVTFLP
jgi:hypothetical protein